MKTIAGLTALLMAFTTAVRAGLVEGSAAHARGDYADALAALGPLAQQGDASAQFTIGLMYEKGQGVGKDDAEALRWYRKAADSGHARSQYMLPVGYEATKEEGLKRLGKR